MSEKLQERGAGAVSLSPGESVSLAEEHVSLDGTDDELAAREIRVAVSRLTRSSWVSLVMVAVGTLTVAASVYYSFTRLQPLEDEISQKRAEIERLTRAAADERQRVEAARQEYAALRSNIEKLYAVRVTPTNQVYELKATAKATGRNLGSDPEYRFVIGINAPPSVLNGIKSIRYTFDDPTFKRPIQVSDDPATQFSVSYTGWGCLNDVGVQIELTDGTKHSSDFDMCKSLGPEWSS